RDGFSLQLAGTMGEMPTCHPCSHFAIARGELGPGKAAPPPCRRRQGQNGPCKKACVHFAGASGELAMSLVARASWQNTRPTSSVPHVACIGH
ncbi:hypothetical protein PIB30_097928, partial [Stylosanthes scabra]|nr:hypothetical protein [Stylosanthes scabra]